MRERKFLPPFNALPKAGMLTLDGVFKHITTKPTNEVEEENEVST